MAMPLSAYVHRTVLTDSDGTQTEGVNTVATYIWDAGGLQWIKNTGGGGGGGGTQYAEGTTVATATGTVALGKKATNVVAALSLDTSGNLNVNLVAGTITGGNAAASPTGAAVPASAGYTGFNSGGNLVGVSAAAPLPTQITNGTNPVGVKALNVQVVAADYGLITNTVIHGLTEVSTFTAHPLHRYGNNTQVAQFEAVKAASVLRMKSCCNCGVPADGGRTCTYCGTIRV